MKDLNKDGPFTFGGLTFSHGLHQQQQQIENNDESSSSSWLFAYNTNNKRPHSISPYEVQTANNDTDMVLFCIRHA